MQAPLISVVVPVRQAVDTAEDTLMQLLDVAGSAVRTGEGSNSLNPPPTTPESHQRPRESSVDADPLSMGDGSSAERIEVIAVVSAQDPSATILRQLRQRRPELVLLEIEGRLSAPQLRAHGIRAAHGRYVAITEDHCGFRPGWPRILVEVLDDPKIGASGGGVANGRRESLVDWAIYFSRYASVMPPLPRGTAHALPGNNACYRRELLDSMRALYEDGFWEHEFHQHLIRQGFRLFQEPSAVVAHRKPYRFLPYCVLRFRHGRCFGGMIREGAARQALVGRLLRSPLTPLLLALRSARAVWAKQTCRKEYCLSLPLLMFCYLAWTAGEAAGYLWGAGDSCSQTD